ncbi:MAG: hypothetical protein JOY64_29115 [Alphaproteobacteria bacterium]|nr:hypothetical protein [Alphaproteobacteria bacterium]MBV8411722.1 hypothetical protein [Alphaproteobacteria bacterium]
MIRRAFLLAALLASTSLVPAQFVPAQAASDLQVIYVGGWDCPPCAVWKKTQKARWLASPEFQQVRWIEIESPRLRDAYQERYWPLEVKPLLAKLPRKSGTPRFLIVRDGEIVSNQFGVPGWSTTMADLKKLLGE